MRSLLVSMIIFGSLPFILVRPHIGVLVFSWISYMNPHRLTWGFAYDFPFAMVVGVVTFFAWIISRESKALPMTPLTVLMLLFLFWVSLTTVFAIDFELSYPKWIQFFKIMSVTLLTIILINTQQRIDAFIWIIVLSIGFFGVKGGIWMVQNQGTTGLLWGPPGSFIQDNNALALALLLILPLIRYLQLYAGHRLIRIGLLCSIAPLLLSVVASYSRGAFLTMAVMTFYICWKSRQRVLLIFALFVALAVGLTVVSDRYFNRIETIENYDQDGSAMARLNTWQYAFNFTKDHPILGGGFNMFYLEEPWERYAPDPTLRPKAGGTWNAHSIYFEVMGMHGFVGLAIFLICGFVAFFTCRSVQKRTRDRPDLYWARDLAAMCQVSLVGFAVGGTFLNLAFFDLPWHIVALVVINSCLVRKELARQPSATESEPSGAVPVAAAMASQSPFWRTRSSA